MTISRRALFRTLAASATAAAELPGMCEYGGNHPEAECGCDPHLLDADMNFRIYRAGRLGGRLLPRDQWIEVLPPATLEDYPTERFMIA